MDSTAFDQLMERYLTGKVSEEEKIKIEAWLDVMKTRDNIDLELSDEMEDALFRKITSKTSTIDEVVSIRPHEHGMQSNPWIVRIAASIIMVVSVAFVAWYYLGRNQDRQEAVSVDGVEKIILSDGSLVWLRPGSKLTYFKSLKDGIRYCELEGEALFEVAKDAYHPFIVQCGEVNIKVMGTSFNINTGVEQLILRVLTGKVNLSTAVNREGVNVLPNEQVIYKRAGTLEKLALDTQEIASLTENTSYVMRFTNSTMQEVMDKLENKFNVEISPDVKELGNCRITADFTDHSLESSLQMIREVLDIEYTKSGNMITLTGRGCQQ